MQHFITLHYAKRQIPVIVISVPLPSTFLAAVVGSLLLWVADLVISGLQSVRMNDDHNNY